MTQKEKQRLREMLDTAVESYLNFMAEPDLFNQPCYRRETNHRQHKAFMLASELYNYGFITWEECCYVWTKIGLSEDTPDCPNIKCKANESGRCTIVKEVKTDEDTVQGDTVQRKESGTDIGD